MTDSTYFSVLQAGFTVEGNIVSDHGMTCVGLVLGSIRSSRGLVHVAKGAVVRGDVHAEHIIVDGTVEGEIRAHSSVLLNGRVTGQILYGGTIRLGAEADLKGVMLSRTPVIAHDEASISDPRPTS